MLKVYHLCIIIEKYVQNIKDKRMGISNMSGTVVWQTGVYLGIHFIYSKLA